MSKTRADHTSSPHDSRHDSKLGSAKGDAPRLTLSFLTSAPSLDACPADNTPEVAFAGRSNAGKSSVLNRLSGSRQTAKVSKTPGRTQLLNFFSIKEAGGSVEERGDTPGYGRLVDLPGYGYAKAGRAEQARWQAAVNEYLSHRDNLVALVLVMDIRHPLQAYDLEIVDWATASELPMLILLNKADKLKYGPQQRTLQTVCSRLRNSPLIRTITFSATTGLNLPELLDFLATRLASDRPDQ